MKTLSRFMLSEKNILSPRQLMMKVSLVLNRQNPSPYVFLSFTMKAPSPCAEKSKLEAQTMTHELESQALKDYLIDLSCIG